MHSSLHAEETKTDELDRIKRDLDREQSRKQALDRKASALAKEMAAVRREMIAVARAAQDREDQLSAVESMLDQLNADVVVKRAELIKRRGQMRGTLAALERLALRPPEALILQPATPKQTIHSAMLLRAVVPALKDRSRTLGSDLATLADLRREIVIRHDELLTASLALEDDRARLGGLFGRKSELQNQVRKESKETVARLKKLAREAKDLSDLVARLEPESSLLGDIPPEGGAAIGGVGSSAEEIEVAALAPAPAPAPAAVAPPPGLPFSQARGMILFPARGAVVAGYGKSMATGLTSKGLRVATRPEAQVVAPYDGKVVFAGPFRGYGQLLIIAHGEGYHILLAGLSRIDSAPGQHVLAGEPLGVMGPSENGGPSLYIELRRKGEPINPLPWMAASRGKVSG